jgi:hypothetical protein
VDPIKNTIETEEVKGSIKQDEQSLSLNFESHPFSSSTKEIKKKSNIYGLGAVFKKQPEALGPSDVEFVISEVQEKPVPQEDNKGNPLAYTDAQVSPIIPSAQSIDGGEKEATEPHKEESLKEGPIIAPDDISKGKLVEGRLINEEKTGAEQTETVEPLSDEDEEVKSAIELDPNVQSDIRNIKLQQINFTTDADNGLSYERMHFVTTRIHPYVIRKAGMLLVNWYRV